MCNIMYFLVFVFITILSFIKLFVVHDLYRFIQNLYVLHHTESVCIAQYRISVYQTIQNQYEPHHTEFVCSAQYRPSMYIITTASK